MTIPAAHCTQIYSTNPLERLNAEIKRQTNVVGIFLNDASVEISGARSCRRERAGWSEP